MTVCDIASSSSFSAVSRIQVYASPPFHQIFLPGKAKFTGVTVFAANLFTFSPNLFAYWALVNCAPCLPFLGKYNIPVHTWRQLQIVCLSAFPFLSFPFLSFLSFDLFLLLLQLGKYYFAEWQCFLSGLFCATSSSFFFWRSSFVYSINDSPAQFSIAL